MIYFGDLNFSYTCVRYYPYLYAPLGTDLRNLSSLKIEFEEGYNINIIYTPFIFCLVKVRNALVYGVCRAPFTPLLQLLSVLPPQSGKLLPTSYSELMTDEASPLHEYYPPDFEVDANGKKNSWEYIVRIPFINESSLIGAVSKIDHARELSDSERLRNVEGSEHRFVPHAGQRKSSPEK